MVNLSPFDPFGLSRTDIENLTYKEAWEWYFELNLAKKDKETFAPAEMDEEEANKMFDRLCSDHKGNIRKYEGKRWWLGEDPDVKIYNGPKKKK